MQTSPRKRNETIVLAGIAIAAVAPLRYLSESRWCFIAEFTTLLVLFCVAVFAKSIRRDALRWNRVSKIATIGLAVTPILFAFLAHRFATPIAFEISALSTFGTFALAIAIGASRSRTQAMSLVISGFLVLFTTVIADESNAVLIAIFWMAVCIWHLVANHWEKLDVCMAENVRPNISLRPATVLLAIALSVVGGLVAHDRFQKSNRLRLGFMPTSGGSQWSDPAARSGVGTGDAVIAAVEHAESFGAVDSEIFLESNESTLFDMFSDSIGEPKIKQRLWERRQSMGNEDLIPMHQRTTRSEQVGSSFSTDRMPPKKHRHLQDAIGNAVVQWDGPTGIRLAMERFDTFDGIDWTNSAQLARSKLMRQTIDQQDWFFDPKLHRRVIDSEGRVSVHRLKVLRLDSARIPTPMMTAGLNIKDVDRQDFFGIADDGSLFMPDRTKIPPLTVLNLASISVMEDELLALLRAESEIHPESRSTALVSVLQPIINSATSPYEQLQSVIGHLRTNFTFDRNVAMTDTNPIGEFLRTRRGGDHLFATVAALMARQLGLRSRLVTGFYVRPDTFEMTAGHANVMTSDVHVWVEIQLSDGRWFEIEPTPGYREPSYAPSIWLRCKRFAAAHWWHGLMLVFLALLLRRTRLIWIEWMLIVTWWLARPLSPHRQIGLAMKIVEIRARLVGKPRPIGTPQRDWMESIGSRDVLLQDQIKRFCDSADRAVFGQSTELDRITIASLVRCLSSKTIQQS